MENKRKYKTIKLVLRGHVKKNIRSLWTYKDDNFNCIYKNYKRDSIIHTPSQMLELIDGLTEK